MESVDLWAGPISADMEGALAVERRKGAAAAAVPVGGGAINEGEL